MNIIIERTSDGTKILSYFNGGTVFTLNDLVTFSKHSVKKKYK